MLDTREAIGDHIIDEFPSVSEACLNGGIDPTKQPIPVVPAAHYHMGGVATDKTGMSSIQGLMGCRRSIIHWVSRRQSDWPQMVC